MVPPVDTRSPPLTHICNQKKSAKPEAFCCEHFCFSSFVLLTSPQLVQLKMLFHHILSRSSSVAENAAKNLSAGFTVRMSCFTSNLTPIWYSWRKQTKKICNRKSSPWTLSNWLFPRNWGQVKSSKVVIFSHSYMNSGFTGFFACPLFIDVVNK